MVLPELAPPRWRSTKIIATLGPSTASLDRVRAMVAEGMDCARVNFSHVSDPGLIVQLVDLVRTAADAEGVPVAVLGDLCGPKMRLRHVPDGGVPVRAGDQFLLYPVGGVVPAGAPFPVFAASVPTLCADVRPGDRVMIADGRIEGVVRTVSETAVAVEVTSPGVIEDRKGVNLPDTVLSAAALTPKDIADVAAGLAAGIDVFALSFVRSAADVAQLRALLPASTPVVAKVERPEALERFDEIVAAADGVMVARGDLGVEVGWEVLPGLQMDMLAAAAAQGRLSVVATEMLESMTTSSRPTRAEASDVAGAVKDGTSAVMLSAETSMGADPALVVRAMASILSSIESHGRYRVQNESLVLEVKAESRSAAIAAAATRLARDVSASSIVVVSNTGSTARLVSAARPERPVVALCAQPSVARSLALWWGVRPVVVEQSPVPDVTLSDVVLSLGLGPGPVVVAEGARGATSADRVRIVDL